MNAKFEALRANNTWNPVPPMKDVNIIDYEWVYKIKRKSDNTIDMYKTRLVAKEFKQRYVTVHSALLLKLQ
jgi:hypothetical protein